MGDQRRKEMKQWVHETAMKVPTYHGYSAPGPYDVNRTLLLTSQDDGRT